jgi:membrane-associated phospholipid phosphatase
MYSASPFPNRNFLIGFLLTLITALFFLVNSWVVGKEVFFLMLNIDLGSKADVFFHYWTYLGDGLIWVPVAVLFWLYRRAQFPLLLAAILFSTVITQGCKNFILPGQPRPIAAITNTTVIHTVPGVEVHTTNSFPSGHTGTAFTLFLLGCLLIPNRWFVSVGFVYALLVGYSRIYLAQHFPLDVGGGMFTALFTLLLSIAVQQQWEKRKRNTV